MKNYLLLIFVFTSLISYGQTQSEINFDAGKKYQSADSNLNIVYKKILKEYSDTTFIKNLKESQRLWVKFRDAELKMKYPNSITYGSVQPMCVSLYLTDLTNDRIKTLQTWLDGIEEGDACSGSVKRKN